MQIVAAQRQALDFPFPVVAGAASAASTAHLPGRPQRLQRGGLAYAEGAAARDLYKVVSGCIRTYRFLSDGRRMVASFALPGEVFGLDGRGAHRFSAEAVTEAVVIAFARKEIDDCVGREPGAAHSWQAYALEKLSAAEDRCLLLGRMSAAERVASFLLDMDRRGPRIPGIIDLPMSRYDIADHLGLTAETISRVLTSLRKRGIIADQGQHRVELLDREVLESVADGGE